jgi:cysteine-S-conjugate beta-lyase
MKYNFDKVISRQGTDAVSVDGFRTYLFDSKDVLNLPCPDSELIPMWVADMEFATCPEIIDALKDRVEHGLFGYTEIFNTKFKDSFISWTKSRYGWEPDKDHIVNSPGVVPALYDLIGYICKPDEKILILTPSYSYFKLAADHKGIELLTSDLVSKDGSFFMDFEDIRKKIKNNKVSLFILCSPHNPTGRIWTEAELKELGELCFENNVMVISDEIHCDILRKRSRFTPLAKLFPHSDQIITCMAPSKTFNLAGLMFANLIIPNDALRTQWIKNHFSSENPLSITAALAAYIQGQEWLDELTLYLDDNFNFLKDYLAVHLPKAVFTIPEATYLAWINISAYFPEEENIALFFANKSGVLLEGGNMFVSNANGYIRLNLACPRSRLEEGLKRIKEAMINCSTL